MVTPGMNWFVLRVASNKEDSVRATLLRKIKIENFTHLVNRILVPTEKTTTIKERRLQEVTDKVTSLSALSEQLNQEKAKLSEIQGKTRVPSILKKRNLIQLNSIDRYFNELAERIKNSTSI